MCNCHTDIAEHLKNEMKSYLSSMDKYTSNKKINDYSRPQYSRLV